MNIWSVPSIFSPTSSSAAPVCLRDRLYCTQTGSSVEAMGLVMVMVHWEIWFRSVLQKLAQKQTKKIYDNRKYLRYILRIAKISVNISDIFCKSQKIPLKIPQKKPKKTYGSYMVWVGRRKISLWHWSGDTDVGGGIFHRQSEAQHCCYGERGKRNMRAGRGSFIVPQGLITLYIHD